MNWIRLLTLALAATLSVRCSSDKGKAPDPPGSPKPAAAGAGVATDLAGQDARDFIHYVAIVNLAEMTVGKLAVERASANEVKKFAQMMIDDHTASGDKLKLLASDLKIEPPDQLDDKHKDQRDKLAEKSGADFDREYAGAMVDGHKDLIDQLEPRIDKKTLEQWKVETNGKPSVAGATVALLPDASDNPTTMRTNQFAAALYPIVHAHAEAAKALESSLKSDRR